MLLLWLRWCYVVAMATKRRPKARRAGKAPKNETVRLRVSATDKAAFEAAAERETLDFSSWARRILLREAGALRGSTT